MAFSIVPAAPGHIPHLALNMRESDRDEVWAAHGSTPQEAISHSLAVSTRAWCLLLGAEPAAMWGVGAPRTLASSMGAPWLLASPRLYELRRPFLRQSRHFIGLMHRDFPILENYVHAQNLAAIRWLVWCGFTLAPRPAPYGKFKQPFYRFWSEHVQRQKRPRL